MPFSIQTNVSSLIAQENLRVSSNFQSSTIQRLTSGYRINQSGDDAAGLAVANKFRSDISELTQGVHNANDGVSQLQIIDGGMNNIAKMLDRLKTLATQSASDTFTGDRGVLNSEYQTLVSEISRQAQTIGLDQGGSFAKTLGVYLGGGAGTSTSAILANGVVAVDLSKATVDAQSLGLKGVQAINGTAYDLSATSTTSVQAIVSKAANVASLTSGNTLFTFTGPGFGDYNGITVSVATAGIFDTNSLVTAINAAITNAGNGSTTAAAAFKSAGITASVVKDPTGATNDLMLSFSSSKAAFEVQGGDRMANAFLGNFAGANDPTGATLATTTYTGAGAMQAAATTFSAAATLTVTGGGYYQAVQFTFAATTTVGAALAALQSSTALAAAGIVVTGTAGTTALTFSSKYGEAFTVQYDNGGNTADQLGLGASAKHASAASTFYAGISNGAYQLGQSSAVYNLAWADMTVNDQQAVTITANDATGAAHVTTVTLAAGGAANQITGTGSSIDAAVYAINQQLQSSTDSTLQQITAVKVNVSGTEKINFVSNLKSFSVAVGSNTTANMGLNYSVGNLGAAFQSLQVGTGNAADISTASGAQTAITALTAAVASLGNAQAAVGKGQNQLGYAIGLAYSQINNFSAAQAQIRDADVAAEAANLTKAQVLQQASMAAMAQANSAPQGVLALLRG